MLKAILNSCQHVGTLSSIAWASGMLYLRKEKTTWIDCLYTEETPGATDKVRYLSFPIRVLRTFCACRTFRGVQSFIKPYAPTFPISSTSDSKIVIDYQTNMRHTLDVFSLQSISISDSFSSPVDDDDIDCGTTSAVPCCMLPPLTQSDIINSLSFRFCTPFSAFFFSSLVLICRSLRGVRLSNALPIPKALSSGVFCLCLPQLIFNLPELCMLWPMYHNSIVMLNENPCAC
ncbi:hypothetical protein BDP27DRAFT_436915 [Rhodocollybia butyracea]|uniref:Uncharacterized protein n=1 Tax=Rhodocollybia butyracea TaxID=206335 RepID=A0A9P5P714_9AGAR|nr:hypothetical protein BDP27DRAFT_436915 [Rhodocollybia butyracea]